MRHGFDNSAFSLNKQAPLFYVLVVRVIRLVAGAGAWKDGLSTLPEIVNTIDATGRTAAFCSFYFSSLCSRFIKFCPWCVSD
jgi:hypothetical protein